VADPGSSPRLCFFFLLIMFIMAIGTITFHSLSGFCFFFSFSFFFCSHSRKGGWQLVSQRERLKIHRYFTTVKLYMLFRAVFWVVLPCKMIVDRRFRGAYCLHHQG
jgi:hypothetical protein